MTGRGPVPSQGSSREGSGPLYPDGHCHQVFQQEDCLFSGAPPSSSPVLFLSTPDQNAEWFYPRAQVGRLRLWRGSHLPQSHGCPRAHVLRALPFPSAPRPSLLGKRNVPSEQGDAGLWAASASSGPHGFLGAAQSHTQSWEERGTATHGFVCRASTGLIREA